MKLLLVLALLTPSLMADFAAGLNAYQKKDYAGALKEWKPLADSGDPAAQFNLALMYLDGTGVPQSYDHAVEWFKRSADHGYTKAQYNLGGLYAGGKGVKRNYITAHFWLNVCASSGDAKCAAQRDLVAQKMKAKDLAEAQRQAVAWKATPTK